MKNCEWVLCFSVSWTCLRSSLTVVLRRGQSMFWLELSSISEEGWVQLFMTRFSHFSHSGGPRSLYSLCQGNGWFHLVQVWRWRGQSRIDSFWSLIDWFQVTKSGTNAANPYILIYSRRDPNDPIPNGNSNGMCHRIFSSCNVSQVSHCRCSIVECPSVLPLHSCLQWKWILERKWIQPAQDFLQF